ncbi:MAG TPA: hypothetical protein PKY31_03060 [Spirochaetota bacterium]|nr:hypothetical protein [Spirochaetota bacterium]
MAHQDEGHYRAKHGDAAPPARAVLDAAKADAKDGLITCAAAHGIAKRLNVTPEDVGRAVDFQELKISKCQLGLFGFGKGVKLVKAAESVPADLERDIRAALVDGRIPCRDLWNIADARKMARQDAANACEKLGIRVSRCQLGAF